SRIAGIGNIYAAEALFRARVNPKRPINRLPKHSLIVLRDEIVSVLKEGIAHTVRSYRKPGTYRDREFQVYGREGEPCRVCGGRIKRIEQGGRSTCFCPRCQK